MYTPPYSSKRSDVGFVVGSVTAFGLLIAIFILALLSIGTDYSQIVNERGFHYVGDQPNGANGKQISVEFGTVTPPCVGKLIVPDDSTPVVLEMTVKGAANTEAKTFRVNDPWVVDHEGGEDLRKLASTKPCFPH